MASLLLSRRWLGGLGLAILGMLACVWLGRWQWNESQAPGGDLQNLAYAFNWWLFAVLCVGVWGKALRDELRRPLADIRAEEAVAHAAYVAGRREIVNDESDTELADWNAWLAALNSNPRR